MGDVVIMYQKDVGPIFGLMRAQVTGGNQQPFISVPTSFGLQSGPGVFGGFTLAAGLVSERRDRHGPASDRVRHALRLHLGRPHRRDPRAERHGRGGLFLQCPTERVEVSDAAQQPVATFAIASGTTYDANGVPPGANGFAAVARSGMPVPSGTGVFAAFPPGPAASAAAFLASARPASRAYISLI